MLIWCAYAILTFGIFYYLWRFDHNPKAPPGPTPWPILGNLIHMARASNNLTLTMATLGKTYGEIVSLQMGMKKAVILTSREAMETILCNEAAFGKDRSGMLSDRSFGKNLGIALSDGKLWEKSRTWTFRNIREFGFGKSLAMEHYIQDGTEVLFRKIDDQQNKNGEVDVELLFSYMIYMITWQMIFNRLSPEDIEDIEQISEHSLKFVQSSFFGAGIVNAYPFIRHIFPQTVGYKDQMGFFNTCSDIAKKIYVETKKKLSKQDGHGEPPANLAEAFIKNESQDDEIFNCENFQIIFEDVMTGSGETTGTFMEGVVLFLILYPDIQEKIYQEILALRPDGDFLNFESRKKMVFTQAFIAEVHRFSRVLQNFIPRKALKDFSYKEYIIKKDTLIIPDTYLYYNDESVWGDPEAFRPERFINEQGELCSTSKIISFSFGKRNCPGEMHFNVVAFILLTSILQRYRLSVPHGKPKPRSDLKAGFSFRTYPFQAYFVKRV